MRPEGGKVGNGACRWSAWSAWSGPVNTSFGTQFSDCFPFDNQGDWAVGYVSAFIYAVNFQDGPYFSAGTTLSQAESLNNIYTFAGRPKGKTISLIGTDGEGDNYYVTGAVGSCTRRGTACCLG